MVCGIKMKSEHINKASFGAYIKKCRKAKGMKQSDLAAALDMHIKSVSCFERGETFPSQENIFKLAQILDMSLDEYVFGVRLGEETICISEINMLIKELSPEKRSFLISIINDICKNLKQL